MRALRRILVAAVLQPSRSRCRWPRRRWPTRSGPWRSCIPCGSRGTCTRNTTRSLGVDAAGNALFATFDRATNGDDQVAVYERCGTTWNRKLVGSPANNFFGYGMQVAPDGTAMAVWRADDAGGTLTYYSSVRPPGGAWGSRR